MKKELPAGDDLSRSQKTAAPATTCRRGCGACCIAPSIHGPIPGMPDGKPAGVPCVNLDPLSFDCRLWGGPDYPEACRRFAAEPDVCGNNRDEALRLITAMEIDTARGN